MSFHSMLVLVTWVGVMLTAIMAAAAIAYSLALPNCSDSCGDVKIPYPFGTTPGCYRKEESRDFFINCSESYRGQPQPMSGDFPVTSISIEGEMDVMMDSSISCYNQWGTPLSNNTDPWLRVPSFTVSVTKNKFVAVGCDTYAFLNGILNDAPFTTGCLSKCNNTHNIVNGSCSGIGCCQIDIPEGLKEIDFAAYSFNNHSDVWSFNPCSFAFIIQKDKFSFSSAYLTSLQNNETFPMVLDWAIGNETCEVARNKGNYICGANSNCSDVKNGSASGYTCKCKEGYDGNPYLKDGCRDIDECNEEKICPVKQNCFNEVGSYRCSCINGYRKVEDVCVPSLTIYLVVEIAGALAYLHSSTSTSIIHRDVKTANILLDDDYTAKVADFGASRLVPLDQTQLNTLVQGTWGYLDPEYMQTSQLTEKSDVYSFGVVMAELLTGKKALSFDRPENDRNLAISFVSAIKEDCLLQILEDHIVSEGNIEQLKEIANLAKWCLSLRGEDRPFMKEVAKELERLRSMEKTPLGNIDVDGKKAEDLLSATSHSFNIDAGTGCSTSTTTEYDSIKEQVLKSVENGR